VLQEREEWETRAVRAEKGIKELEDEKSAAVARLENEAALLREQLGGGGGNEGGAKALQAAELRAVQGALEDKLRHTEGELRKAQSERQRLENELQVRKTPWA